MLEEGVRRLAKGRNFAALTTLLPDGQPMTHVMWVDCDDEHILINTETHRQKARNMRRDPRVTVAIWEADDPYRYAEVRDLKGKGVMFEHYDMPGLEREGDVHVGGDMKIAWFKDPDGNILNVGQGPTS